MVTAAREGLLDAARVALARRPWSAVRMVDVAAAAGVSRQTLYNEFGDKDGLARALVRREADGYLAGVERALAGPGGPGERLTATAEWTAAAARGNALVRALLTGCWEEGLPAPARAPGSGRASAPWPAPAAAPGPGRSPSPSTAPDRSRADGPLPSPGDLVGLVRDRAVAVLRAPGTSRAEVAALARSCELAVRLALSCVAAPPAEGDVTELVRPVLPPS
ncbi:MULTISPECIES: TetR/AcrR family transcriptional regulator [unclassified Streptomyces]|uniref:TetR/AcrR family transcriptional regulator n=1 Tax=unclassified Streptomyces TaxID=2593676 RepID=UPI0022384998|nr:TetR/AcrR family transcriptional regulator [Streptomyces sp. SHP 1-2]MCW5250475.1 TetR/AcrR family transcriptional regulator [Streptomyces sp. SHP 1-2]